MSYKIGGYFHNRVQPAARNHMRCFSHTGIELCGQCGRIGIRLNARNAADKLRVELMGGRAHVGAIARAACGEARVRQRKKHREGPLALWTASTLARETGANVVVICGIHYDNISLPEIECALKLARALVAAFAEYIKGDSDADNGAA